MKDPEIAQTLGYPLDHEFKMPAKSLLARKHKKEKKMKRKLRWRMHLYDQGLITIDQVLGGK